MMISLKRKGLKNSFNRQKSGSPFFMKHLPGVAFTKTMPGDMPT